jgi:hypothetical protein
MKTTNPDHPVLKGSLYSLTAHIPHPLYTPPPPSPHKTIQQSRSLQQQWIIYSYTPTSTLALSSLDQAPASLAQQSDYSTHYP